MKVIDSYNLITGSVVTLLTSLFGKCWYIFAAFLLLEILDYATGSVKSKIYGKLSSAEGAKGIFKKLGYLVAIVVAFVMSNTLVEMLKDTIGINAEFLMLFGWLTVATLMINEARSIIENLVEIGCEVPEFLVKGLAVTEKLIEDAADSSIPNQEEEKVKVTKEVIK